MRRSRIDPVSVVLAVFVLLFVAAAWYLAIYGAGALLDHLGSR